MRSWTRLTALTLVALAFRPGGTVASAPNRPVYGTRLQLPGLDGALVLSGPDRIASEAIVDFARMAGERDGDVVLLVAGRTGSADSIGTRLRRRTTIVEHVVDTDDRAATTARLADAVGVWLHAGTLSEVPGWMGDTLRDVLGRGGVVGLSPLPSTAAGGCRVGHAEGDPVLLDGWGLLPGFVVDACFAGSEGAIPVTERLREERPGVIGIGLDAGTGLVARGRRGRIVGGHSARMVLPPADPPLRHRPASVRLRAGAQLDLIAFSRAAVARCSDPRPETSGTRRAVGGTLFLGGGGGIPRGLLRRFIEASGGRDALIVVIPTAIGNHGQVEHGNADARFLRRSGARRVEVLHADTPSEAETPRFLDALERAGGIWFSGGRQWRLVDSYLDTKAHEAMLDVLRRGGAACGSSAGATIQAGYLVRGHPLGNMVMMAEGYERGLRMLPGVAVDQHFTQRDRMRDMARLKRTFPELLGIGIDEGTFIIVRDRIMEVVGPNRVAVYADPPRDGAEPDVVSLTAGDRFDLVTQARVE